MSCKLQPNISLQTSPLEIDKIRCWPMCFWLSLICAGVFWSIFGQWVWVVILGHSIYDIFISIKYNINGLTLNMGLHAVLCPFDKFVATNVWVCSLLSYTYNTFAYSQILLLSLNHQLVWPLHQNGFSCQQFPEEGFSCQFPEEGALRSVMME